MQKFYPNYIKKDNLPSWEEIILDFDYNIRNDFHVKLLENYGIVTHNGHNIESVKRIKDHIHKNFGEYQSLCTAHIYISLLSFSSTFGRHKDSTDVYFILAQGSMSWKVEYEDGDYETTMSPGDMIFLPKGIYHTPFPITPRVGISIGFD
jgi:ribosomal protein L16 Arg81 hydroxylase